MNNNIPDGAKTQLQKGQARTDARLDNLESRCDAFGDDFVVNVQRIAKLEALQGVDQEDRPSFWNSTNGRLIIAAVLIGFLAYLGWTAQDIISLAD